MCIRDRSLGLVGKGKLLFSYFQVVLVMPEAFAVALPQEYKQAMVLINWMSLDWIGVGVHHECLGSFGTRLLLTAYTPLVMVCALLSGGAVASVASAALDGGAGGGVRSETVLDDARRGALSALPPALWVLFALVPSVSSRIFSTWSCERFGYADCLLYTSPSPRDATLSRMPSSA